MFTKEGRQFTPDDQKEIEEISGQLAAIGEEALGSLVYARFSIIKMRINILESNLGNPQALIISDLLGYDQDIITAAIEGARDILKAEGRDAESILKKELLRREFGYLDSASEE